MLSNTSVMDNSTPKSKFVSTGFIVVLLVIFVVPYFLMKFATWWPPTWMERRTQREFVFTNIEAAGGWPAFKSECDSLISLARTSRQNQWFPRLHSAEDYQFTLPPSCKIISRLNPWEVDVNASDENVTYVLIRVFGMHRTGGRDTPSYYLVYQALTNSDECVAANIFHRVKPREITNSIFEVY